MTEASAPTAHSVADPFKADDTNLNSANSTKLTPNTSFTFGMSTPAKNDDHITKPVTPVSDHSPDQSDKSDSYSYMPAGAPTIGFAGASLHSVVSKESGEDSVVKPPKTESGKSVQAPAPSANLNPTGVFSTIPGLGLGVNAAADRTESASKTTGRSDTGGPVAGQKRKAEEDIEHDSQNKPSTGSSVLKSLKATVEDFDSGAESSTWREPDAKRVKGNKENETATTNLTSSTAPVVTANSSGKSVEPEAVAEKAEKTEKTNTAVKKQGRPKKGKTEKKAPAPIGQTARKTRSQGPAA